VDVNVTTRPVPVKVAIVADPDMEAVIPLLPLMEFVAADAEIVDIVAVGVLRLLALVLALKPEPVGLTIVAEGIAVTAEPPVILALLLPLIELVKADVETIDIVAVFPVDVVENADKEAVAPV
jgi:hypothetical protein